MTEDLRIDLRAGDKLAATQVTVSWHGVDRTIDCVRANEREGWIDLLRRNYKGKFVADGTGRIAVDRLVGPVKIIGLSDEQRREHIRLHPERHSGQAAPEPVEHASLSDALAAMDAEPDAQFGAATWEAGRG